MKWSHLVIHHTAGTQSDTVDSVRKYHKAHDYADIGYHFFSERDSNGKWHLKRGRPDTMQGCHGVKSWNLKALGYCIAGNYSKYAPDEALYQHILGSVKHIIELYNIPPENVLGHANVKPTACPGDKFPLVRLKRDIK